jgi:hypothetical protein
MTIHVYSPQISVTLFKMIGRKNGVAARYEGAKGQIDLTPFLGDTGTVETDRSLSEPAGSFTITFPDQPTSAIQDSVYAFVEPMDMIEIRMARSPYLYGQTLPINMRGFVSSVRRVEVMGDDGSPQRQVIIVGQNFGKLWQINGVFWQVAYQTDQPLLTLYQVQAALGMQVGFESASQFISGMTTQVMNKRIAQLSAFSNRQVLPFNPVCSVNQGQVTPPATATLTEGSYWDIINTFADSPWNELFIRDVESGPELVFRPTPFKDINGNLIMPDAVDPGSIRIDISDVVQLDVGRNDQSVANFFWVDPSTSSLDTSGAVTAANIVEGSLLDFNYPNNNPALYGYRQMQGNTMLFPDGVSELPTQIPADNAAVMPGNSGYVEWWQLRALQLKWMNRDNAVFEEGSIIFKGNENAVPGIYLKLRRGPIISSAYIVSVKQTFSPFQNFMTQATVERGDGFLLRNKAAGSPYYAEGRSGPYDPVAPFVAKISIGAVTEASANGAGS